MFFDAARHITLAEVSVLFGPPADAMPTPIPVRDVRQRMLFSAWLGKFGSSILRVRREPVLLHCLSFLVNGLTEFARFDSVQQDPDHIRRLKTGVCSRLASFPATASTSNRLLELDLFTGRNFRPLRERAPLLLPAFVTAIAEASGLVAFVTWNSMLHLPPLPFPVQRTEVDVLLLFVRRGI